MSQISEANSLQRITIQITKSQHEMLKHYARPGTSISAMIRRAIDDMFQPVREQALEDAKYEKWEREAIANKQIMPEAPEMELWKDLQPKQTTNKANNMFCLQIFYYLMEHRFGARLHFPLGRFQLILLDTEL